VNLDAILWCLAGAAEAAVIGLLVHRRIWRTLPVFFSYSFWALIAGLGAWVVAHYFPSRYLGFYFVEIIIDSSLLLGILVELAWSFLRPVRVSLPRATLGILVVLVLLAGAAIWPFSAVRGIEHSSRTVHLVIQLQQTVSVLQIIFFLGLIAGSQLLSIGWRDREMQVATGFGFYALTSLTVAMIHAHETAVSQYWHLNQVLIAGYICSLGYWIFSFARKEAARKEFTPQMQGILLAVAGAARSTRMAMVEAQVGKTRRNGDH